jgi:hypothetical protein
MISYKPPGRVATEAATVGHRRFRGFRNANCAAGLAVPRDCVASNTGEKDRYAFDQLRWVLRADVRPSAERPLRNLAAELARSCRR